MQKRIFTTIICMWVFFLTTMAQGYQTEHVVKKGETLYRLSKVYGITVDQILQHNPGVASSGLKEGMRLLVPTIEQVAEHKNDEEIILPQHKVKRKETLWSISKQYGTTVEALKEANPQLAPEYKIKRGTKLNIPLVNQQEIIKDIDSKKKYAGMSNVKVGVILPFETKGLAAERCVEFYRGFLMAADVLRNQGRDIEIYAYNEPKADVSILPQLQQVQNNNVDVLIGPLYFEHFSSFVDFSSKNHVYTIFPFSSKVGGVEHCNHALLLNAPDAQKIEYAVRLFMKHFTNVKVVFLLDNEGNELNFMHTLRNSLIHAGMEVADLAPGWSDVEMKAVCSVSKPTIFVPANSSRQTCRTLLERVKMLRLQNPNLNVSLLGYPEWLEWEAVELSSYCDANTYIFANAYYASIQDDVKSFERTYREWFKTDMLKTTPSMGLLGYDCANAVLEGFFQYGKDYPMCDASSSNTNYVTLQSNIHFQPIAPGGGYINDSMMFIHYVPGGYIEKILKNE